MTELRILDATRAHALAMAPNLRPADAEEARAATGLPADAALLAALARSTQAWTCLVDDEPACMWGVGPLCLAAGQGCPWLLGTRSIERHPRAFLRQSRIFLRLMLRTWSVLANHVDARNRQSLRWLSWLGFTIGTAEPYGAHGLPFHPFSMRRGHV